MQHLVTVHLLLLLLDAKFTSYIILFILYTADLGGISAQYGVRSHFYADDSQLYISARPHEAANAASQLVDCMESMAQWMASNRLKLIESG